MIRCLLEHYGIDANIHYVHYPEEEGEETSESSESDDGGWEGCENPDEKDSSREEDENSREEENSGEENSPESVPTAIHSVSTLGQYYCTTVHLLVPAWPIVHQLLKSFALICPPVTTMQSLITSC